jgi:cytochrome c oxidase subunit 2
MAGTRVCTVSLLTLAVLGVPASGQNPSRVVHVVAERFSFTPSELTVDEGTVLELRISSDDTAHGFKILGPPGASDINVEIPKRGRGDVRVTFDAKEPGTYVFECSRVCGAGHGFMRGTIRVRPRSGS